jgi:hypothetical protein
VTTSGGRDLGREVDEVPWRALKPFVYQERLVRRSLGL